MNQEYSNIINKMFSEYNQSKSLDIELEVSLSCNFNCSYCCAHSMGFPREISNKHFEFVEKLYDYKKLHNLPIRIIVMGGEPLYQKNIKDFLQHLIKYDFNSLLFTNGVFIEAIEEYYDYFDFIISIHEQQIYQKFKNPKNYFNMFYKLSEIKKKLPYEKYIFNYLINLKKNTLNGTFYQKFMQDIPNVLIRPLTHQTYTKQEIINYKKIINELKPPVKSINERIYKEFLFYVKNNFKFNTCFLNNFYVDSFGNIRNDCTNNDILGNVFDNFDIMDNIRIRKQKDCPLNCTFTDTLTVKKYNE